MTSHSPFIYHSHTTQTVTIEQLQEHAGELLAGLHTSDEIIVSDGGTAVAKISALPQPAEAKNSREFGFWAGQIETTPDFDEPLPDSFWLGDK